jgi:hypothetical protein
VSRRFRTHAVGVTFFAFVGASTLLSIIGVNTASTAHAPTWALFLFYSLLTMSIPLGGSIGYLFYIPKRRDDDAR